MEINLLENERIDDLERNGLKIIQNTKGFCFGMDAVLLSGFAADGIMKRSNNKEAENNSAGSSVTAEIPGSNNAGSSVNAEIPGSSNVGRSSKSILDLGTGTGILPILLYAKTDAGRIAGLEIQKQSADNDLWRRGVVHMATGLGLVALFHCLGADPLAGIGWLVAFYGAGQAFIGWKDKRDRGSDN